MAPESVLLFTALLLELLVGVVRCQDMPPPILENTTTTTTARPTETTTEASTPPTTTVTMPPPTTTIAPSTTTMSSSTTVAPPAPTTARPSSEDLYCYYKAVNMWPPYWPTHNCGGKYHKGFHKSVPTSCYRCCYKRHTHKFEGCKLVAQYYCNTWRPLIPQYHSNFYPISRPYYHYGYHYRW